MSAFRCFACAAGDTAAEATGANEVILVMVEGRAQVSGAGRIGDLGDRMSVFEKTPPHCLYLPDGSEWSARAKPIA